MSRTHIPQAMQEWAGEVAETIREGKLATARDKIMQVPPERRVMFGAFLSDHFPDGDTAYPSYWAVLALVTT